MEKTISSSSGRRLLIASVMILGVLCLSLCLLAFLPARSALQTSQSEIEIREPQVASGESVAALANSQSQARAKEQRGALDPRSDGWHTEFFSEQAENQLRTLSQLLVNLEGMDQDVARDTLSSLLAEEFGCGSLRPAETFTAFEDETILVERDTGDGSVIPKEGSDTYRGTDGLLRALIELVEPFASASELQGDFKLYNVDTSNDTFITRQHLALRGRVAQGMVEQNATWLVHWSRQQPQSSPPESPPPEAPPPPELTWIGVEEFEQVTTTTALGPLFTDCTEAVLGANRSLGDQLIWGIDHWARRIERVHMMSLFARYGIAVGDVNGDGLDDLYICQPGGLPNRLFVQNSDGTATDRSNQSGVDYLDNTSSALLIDLDNDGDQDLVLAMSFYLLLLDNDSKGVFRMRGRLRLADHDVQSLSAVDYDNDGDLDLYICTDFAHPAARKNETDVSFVYHNANDGGANVLFRNDIVDSAIDSWRFTDVTKPTGLDVNNRRHSLAAAWEDFDNDDDMDLYVANDYGRNCLYRNDQGHFTDIATTAGVVDHGSGMSVDWGDYNRDGQPDLYVANMFSSAGSRITSQARFRSVDDTPLRDTYQRFAKGNTLFENVGADQFNDIGADAAVEMGRWAWSSVFADVNNDGWEDLVVANGYMTTEDTGDL